MGKAPVRERWIRVPEAVIRDLGLSAEARLTYMGVVCLAGIHADEVFGVSARDIADFVGLARNTVAGALEALVERQHLKRKKEWRRWSYRLTSTIYQPQGYRGSAAGETIETYRQGGTTYKRMVSGRTQETAENVGDGQNPANTTSPEAL